MNDILSFLQSHTSVRNFTDDQITPEQELTIVQTAQCSPTSSNLHAYSIISVRDQKTKKKLAELAGGQSHVAECSLFLVFCADLYRLAKLNEDRGYPFYGKTTEAFIVTTVDAALAGGRALEAAQAMGFGGVMVGGLRNDTEEVSDLLGLPRLVYPVFGMSLGRPKQVQQVKPRLPLEGMWFSEKYNESTIDKAVKTYDDTIGQVGYLRNRQVEPGKYPNFNGHYSWSEHSARRMASDDPDVKRPHMLEFLRKRGLLLE